MADAALRDVELARRQFRDLLIGAVYGVLLSLFETSDNFLLPLFGKLAPQPATPAANALLGVREAFGSVLQYTWIFVLYTLMISFLLFLIRLAVRKDWIAAIVMHSATDWS